MYEVYLERLLEERLNTLETRLDTLQRLFEERLAQPPKKEKRGWQAIVGTFENDPLYEEAMRLGREWRESQYDETNGNRARRVR